MYAANKSILDRDHYNNNVTLGNLGDGNPYNRISGLYTFIYIIEYKLLKIMISKPNENRIFINWRLSCDYVNVHSTEKISMFYQ